VDWRARWGFHAGALLRRPPKMLTGTGGDMSAPKIIEDRRMVRVPNGAVSAHQSTERLKQRTDGVRKNLASKSRPFKDLS
jgi:hypothetical protein